MLKCHMQVVQVHLQPFRCNSVFKCACVAAGNPEKSTKNLFWGFKVIQGYRR